MPLYQLLSRQLNGNMGMIFSENDASSSHKAMQVHNLAAVGMHANQPAAIAMF